MAESPRREAWRAPLLRLLGVLLVLSLWALLARSGWIGRTLLADPLEVLRVFARDVGAPGAGADGLAWHWLATIRRALTGFACGLGAGLVVGWPLGRRHGMGLAASWPLELLRALPPVLIFPVLLVAFDYADAAYEATIAFGVAPIVALGVKSAAERSAGIRFEMLEVHGVSKAEIRRARALDLLPDLALIARVALSLSLVVAVVTEMVFTPRGGLGLGAYAKDAEMTFDTPGVYAALLLMGLTGLLLNSALGHLAARLGGADGTHV